jgi:hypothetical protein
MKHGSATSHVSLCEDVLVIDYRGPLTVTGWISAAEHGADIGEPHRYKAILCRMDRAAIIATPAEVAAVGVVKSAFLARKLPGAIVATFEVDTLRALAARMCEAGHLRRVFTDPLEAFLWIRREARALPVPRVAANLGRLLQKAA